MGPERVGSIDHAKIEFLNEFEDLRRRRGNVSYIRQSIKHTSGLASFFFVDHGLNQEEFDARRYLVGFLGACQLRYSASLKIERLLSQLSQK